MGIHPMVAMQALLLCLSSPILSADSHMPTREARKPEIGASAQQEDQIAMRLGRKVLALKRAIENPQIPNAMQAVTDLGQDQRYYIMVRGWLSQQHQADMSILNTLKDKTPESIRARIAFTERAIRAIDLE